MTNVAKHARAEHVRVRVATDDGHVVIEIADDGTGFDAQAATGGFGLAGMRERVALSGGRLAITPGASGTTLRAVIPLGAAGAALPRAAQA